MGVEPALTAVLGGADVEVILDVLPVPVVVRDADSDRLLFVNAAARDQLPALSPEDASVVTTALGLDRRRVRVMTFEAEEVRRASLLASELEVVLDGVADAIAVQSPDLKLIYANAAAARVYGLPRADLDTFSTETYLEDFEVLDDTGHPLDLARLPGRLALAGLEPEPVVTRTLNKRTGEVRWARIQATGVHDPDGGVRLAITLVEDITELKRSEESQRFLADASRRLASLALDYERTLALVAELAVPVLGESCSVWLDALDTPSEEVAEVLRTGAARLQPRRLVVPMTAAGRVIGAVTLERGGREYDTQDVLVVEDFALRAGAAVENARLYGAASEIARALQTSLLPPHLPDIPGASLGAAYHPASQGLEVGGDFYDVFSTGDGQWYLVIGDVCGKGAEAAAVTALARYTLRSAAARRRSPAAILRWVGDAMLQGDAAGGRFCTIACAHVDLARSPARLTIACGGHPLPVIRRASGRIELFGAPGTLLGLLPDLELQERSTDLHPGDAFVLYTDGLTEARAPFGMWGDAELIAAVRAAPVDGPVGLVESLVASALGDRATPRDDLAVLVLKLDR